MLMCGLNLYIYPMIVVSVNYVALFKTIAAFCYSRKNAIISWKGTFYHHDRRKWPPRVSIKITRSFDQIFTILALELVIFCILFLKKEGVVILSVHFPVSLTGVDFDFNNLTYRLAQDMRAPSAHLPYFCSTYHETLSLCVYVHHSITTIRFNKHIEKAMASCRCSD